MAQPNAGWAMVIAVESPSVVTAETAQRASVQGYMPR
jgi:hypothetical protein